jgi:sulfur carrier protein ThiS
MPEVKIKFQGKLKKVKVKAGATIAEVAREAGINPQTVLFTVKGELVPDTDKAKGTIETLKVISGG